MFSLNLAVFSVAYIRFDLLILAISILLDYQFLGIRKMAALKNHTLKNRSERKKGSHNRQSIIIFFTLTKSCQTLCSMQKMRFQIVNDPFDYTMKTIFMFLKHDFR